MSDADVKIGKRIKERREYLGISQEELAKYLGYKYQTGINKIESGTNHISYNKLVEAAKVLDTTVNYLTGETDNPKRTQVNDIEDAAYFKSRKAAKKMLGFDPDKMNKMYMRTAIDDEIVSIVDDNPGIFTEESKEMIIALMKQRLEIDSKK